MTDWLTAQLAEGFPALKGASMSGSIPIKETLINDLIAEYLARPAAPPAPRAGFDPRALLPLLERASIHAEPGVVTVRFEVKI